YRTDKNLAMAYVDPDYVEPGTEVEVVLIGESTRATICPLCLFDTDNNIPRGM
ncbi:MAG: glycine cleavage T C-terminal barrel domain-containing protein, partial [Granulosicoccus sp.]